MRARILLGVVVGALCVLAATAETPAATVRHPSTRLDTVALHASAFGSRAAMAAVTPGDVTPDDPSGLCGPYFDGPPTQYRQQGYDYPMGSQYGDPTIYKAASQIDMKAVLSTAGIGNPDDLVASWDVLGSLDSTSWIQAGIIYGGNWGPNPNVYVEIHGASGGNPANAHYINAAASLLTTYTMTVFENGTTSPWQYYATITGGGHSYRYPTSGFVTFPQQLLDAQWANEEMDMGDYCQYDDSTWLSENVTNSAGSENPCYAGDSCFFNFPADEVGGSGPNQTVFLLKSWSTHGFESWGNNCYIQGKCFTH